MSAYATKMHRSLVRAVQAIGRARGVNRGPANPVQLDIINDLALPGIEVDETTTWEAIQPGFVEVMGARGAVPSTWADMAACYPDLAVSGDAARFAYAREYPDQTPIVVAARNDEGPDAQSRAVSGAD